MANYFAPLCNEQQNDSNGAPLSGGKVFTYAAGTSTLATTYTEAGAAQANPIILNASGLPANAIWLQGGTSYKFIVQTAANVTLRTADNISGVNDPAVASTTDQWVVYTATPTFISATSFSVAGDQTNLLQVGRRIKTTNAGGTVYSSIAASVFGSVTTVTVLNDMGTLDSGLSQISYGLLSALNTSVPVDQDSVSALRFMTAAQIADARSLAPVMDHTAAIQTAINTGKHVDFVGLYYRAAGLTQATSNQVLYSSTGIARITKSASGALFTSSGSDVQIRNIGFRGDAAAPVFTGDNVVSSGVNFALLNCGSMWAAGRAVKATGSHVQIIGTSSIYQTADATATGFDIEVGVSGTATLYHELTGIYSSQATGGIKLVDTGAHTITGGQFGKLHIAAGTTPAGANGGKTVGARILGATTVELSSAILSANQFGAVAVTFSAGASGCRLDKSNVYAAGATIVNNGNANNLIERETSSGGTFRTKWGQDSSLATLDISPADLTSLFSYSGSLVIPNNQGFKGKDSGGVARNLASVTAGDDINLGYNAGAGNFTNVESGDGGVYAAVNGTSIAQFYASGLRPQADNTLNLGTAAQRWATVFAGTGAINTSDEREKQQIKPIDAAALRAWAKVEYCQFRFNDAVEKKADGARWHVGVIAQRVKEAFEAEGLDAMEYGVLCLDKWEAQPQIVAVETGMESQPARPKGERYGVRYEEALVLECAYLRSVMSTGRTGAKRAKTRRAD